MSCLLSKGRQITCRDTVGGIKNAYFFRFQDITSSTIANSELTDLEGISDIKKYILKRGTASFTETINASSENGTVFFTPSVNIKLHKLTKEDQNELKVLSQVRLCIGLELNELNSNGKNVVLLCGLDNGMELASGTNVSGAAFGDMNGYDWTFEGAESFPTPTVADYTAAPFDNTAFNSGSTITIDAD